MTNSPFVEKTITDSSLIEHVKWQQTSTLDEHIVGDLTIKFKNSLVSYTYPAVPYETCVSFLEAPSCGQYFAKNIKTLFSYTK